ncbi:sulfoxide reductase heme-binding subunit YedZ [Aminobacter lissarensis]|uniref:Sulfoxide reductase heme-binding subunit YedZ n=1 Tax=Aminobacter carboxidus TaxID=376165 RepID=A0A8E2BE54_9HYPH|nr:ferric reductase-like transmembrane domain-containing protein [Aminobacter lissarensis]MBB6469386.1 sulfoxide reductase heme-binding subunit YedZ [Aminobacter lissarensis]
MLPIVPLSLDALYRSGLWRDLVAPTGQCSVALLIAALALTPVRAAFPKSRWSLWLLRRRRAIGLACFSYAVAHAIAFIAAIGRLDYIVEGLAFASMWTGWLAFALMVPVALVSSDTAMRRLGSRWKPVQRLVYPSAALVFSHWLLLTGARLTVVAWLLALLLARATRLFRRKSRKYKTSSPSGDC